MPSYPNDSSAHVQDFHSGGTSSAGTSGADYGVNFSSNALALCMNTVGTWCTNTSKGGLGEPSSQYTGLYFETGTGIVMNVAAGFKSWLSFYYTAVIYGGSVSVFDGLDGTGNLLTTLDLGLTPQLCLDRTAGYDAAYCPFVGVDLAFTGTAKSVVFNGIGNRIVLDDISFDMADVPPVSAVPLPASATLLVGAMGGLALKRRRRAKA